MHPNLLEQLTVFRTVVDLGTFSEAAKRLHKTVSSVSYTIANLETQLRLDLFDRSTYRPTLTPAGRSLYADAELLLRRVDRFEARVNLLTEGAKSKIILSVDALFPRSVLVDALATFSVNFPEVLISVRQRDHDRAVEDVKKGDSDIGVIRIDPTLRVRDIDAVQIGTTQNLLVAAPNHPLAKLKKPFELPVLEDYRQIALSRAPVGTGETGYLFHKTDIWTVADDETLSALVKKGVGWAYINRHVIWKDLEEGGLVILKCKGIREGTRNRFIVVWPVSDPPVGPTQRLIDLLRDRFPAAYPENFDEDFKQWKN